MMMMMMMVVLILDWIGYRVILLAALQDRLERQQQSSDEERSRLQALINHLETRLTDQASSLEQVTGCLLTCVVTSVTSVECPTSLAYLFIFVIILYIKYL